MWLRSVQNTGRSAGSGIPGWALPYTWPLAPLGTLLLRLRLHLCLLLKLALGRLSGRRSLISR